MNELSVFNGLIIGWFLLAGIVFILLFFFAAPYGRYSRSDWGPRTNSRTGWITMEAAAPLIFAVCFVLGSNPTTATTLLFLGLWLFHYIYRAFIYPLQMRSNGSKMPIIIVGFGLLFNTIKVSDKSLQGFV